MLGQYRHDDDPPIVIFGSFLPLSTKKQNVVKVGPPLSKRSGAAHADSYTTTRNQLNEATSSLFLSKMIEKTRHDTKNCITKQGLNTKHPLTIGKKKPQKMNQQQHNPSPRLDSRPFHIGAKPVVLANICPRFCC